ncbi:WGR domain-containing protein [Methylocucumis oryzae]|uniref:Polymerase n=1 Tax=Methylocucumis oryzae TaxID=1632867 RepID=A0A0F3IEJ0_9GAMM|nr:WGR domain-containing protein [Methylocucumis oryzae]KJV05166.1 polymerase [Methylocucumis oryzae]
MAGPWRLHKIQPEANAYRFYSLHVSPGVFGDWALVKEWGRIGSPGTLRNEWFNTEAEAIAAALALKAKKERGGYQAVL